MTLRTDLALLSEWISPDAHVLDLGCGDGTLLNHLRKERNVTGYGLEIDETHILHCIISGLHVIQSDLDQEALADFADNSFDYVILMETLQSIRRPDHLLQEMLRVGREGIVTFPNFGHWKARFRLFFQGFMPIAPASPQQWYNTDSLHLCTVKDFEQLCKTLNITILERSIVDLRYRSTLLMQIFPNLMGQVALYRLKKN